MLIAKERLYISLFFIFYGGRPGPIFRAGGFFLRFRFFPVFQFLFDSVASATRTGGLKMIDHGYMKVHVAGSTAAESVCAAVSRIPAAGNFWGGAFLLRFSPFLGFLRRSRHTAFPGESCAWDTTALEEAASRIPVTGECFSGDS